MDDQTLSEAIAVLERHHRATETTIAELRHLSRGTSGAAAEAAEFPAAALNSWVEVERLADQTHSWPEERGGVEEYDPFVVYRSGPVKLALAHNTSEVPIKDKWRKQIWVFELKPKQPITPFVAADDYVRTRELVSIIRGNGESGRGMFGVGDRLPAAYDDLRVELLGDRIAGHYTKYAVVAHEDDAGSMLRHGRAQVQLRH